jgi:hypothetical protein
MARGTSDGTTDLISALPILAGTEGARGMECAAAPQAGLPGGQKYHRKPMALSSKPTDL